MPNYPITQRHPIKPDYKYDSQEVAKFINYVMTGGRREKARQIVYNAFDIIAEKTEEEPIDIFDQALENIGPYTEVRSRRVGGATYQVPYEVDAKRRLQLSLRWLKDAAKSSQSSEGMEAALSREIIKASNEEGAAFQRKEQAHKMADANKAFAHFAR